MMSPCTCLCTSTIACVNFVSLCVLLQPGAIVHDVANVAGIDTVLHAVVLVGECCVQIVGELHVVWQILGDAAQVEVAAHPDTGVSRLLPVVQVGGRAEEGIQTRYAAAGPGGTVDTPAVTAVAAAALAETLAHQHFLGLLHSSLKRRTK